MKRGEKFRKAICTYVCIIPEKMFIACTSSKVLLDVYIFFNILYILSGYMHKSKLSIYTC